MDKRRSSPFQANERPRPGTGWKGGVDPAEGFVLRSGWGAGTSGSSSWLHQSSGPACTLGALRKINLRDRAGQRQTQVKTWQSWKWRGVFVRCSWPGHPEKTVKGGTTVSGGSTVLSRILQQSFSTQRRPCTQNTTCMWSQASMFISPFLICGIEHEN